MAKALVDTTIIADILLKTGARKKSSALALSSYEETVLPVYAIKEFKAGPLRNYVYTHNKFVKLNSFSLTLDAIQRLSLTPQKYKTATALEAIHFAFTTSIASKTPKDVLDKYGEDANNDRIMSDEMKLAIKAKIMIAWKRRRRITTRVDFELSCYEEFAPYELKNGLIEDKPITCKPDEDCEVKKYITQFPEDLKKIRKTITGEDPKKENTNRAKVLKQIINHPNTRLNQNECRSLGDAVFTCLAPDDYVILTTNTKDHCPLAESIGKKAEFPR